MNSPANIQRAKLILVPATSNSILEARAQFTLLTRDARPSTERLRTTRRCSLCMRPKSPGSALGALLLAVLFTIVAVAVAAIFIGESISISQTLAGIHPIK